MPRLLLIAVAVGLAGFALYAWVRPAPSMSAPPADSSVSQAVSPEGAAFAVGSSLASTASARPSPRASEAVAASRPEGPTGPVAPDFTEVDRRLMQYIGNAAGGSAADVAQVITSPAALELFREKAKEIRASMLKSATLLTDATDLYVLPRYKRGDYDDALKGKPLPEGSYLVEIAGPKGRHSFLISKGISPEIDTALMGREAARLQASEAALALIAQLAR